MPETMRPDKPPSAAEYTKKRLWLIGKGIAPQDASAILGPPGLAISRGVAARNLAQYMKDK